MYYLIENFRLNQKLSGIVSVMFVNLNTGEIKMARNPAPADEDYDLPPHTD
jgi:hypothetical protein